MKRGTNMFFGRIKLYNRNILTIRIRERPDGTNDGRIEMDESEGTNAHNGLDITGVL